MHFITVSTPDTDSARAFYVTGLGWEPLMDVPGEILFFQVAPGVTLGLFDAVKFAADLNSTDVTGPAGLTLSYNVPSPDEVDRVLKTASRAGAEIVKPGQYAAFGGYHGHFRDPGGLLWEVAHNPSWSIGPDGHVRLGPPES